MYPAIAGSSASIDGNDSRHNKPDYRQGGGPTVRTRKKVAPAQRGGMGHSGQKVAMHAQMPAGRSGSGNPASRGGTPHAMHPEMRVPGHGGSPQMSKGMNVKHQFGKSGQSGVPSYPHANPQPGRGNMSGKMSKRINMHFNQKSKGPKAEGMGGKYGSPPVRLDH